MTILIQASQPSATPKEPSMIDFFHECMKEKKELVDKLQQASTNNQYDHMFRNRCAEIIDVYQLQVTLQREEEMLASLQTNPSDNVLQNELEASIEKTGAFYQLAAIDYETALNYFRWR